MFNVQPHKSTVAHLLNGSGNAMTCAAYVPTHDIRLESTFLCDFLRATKSLMMMSSERASDKVSRFACAGRFNAADRFVVRRSLEQL